MSAQQFPDDLSYTAEHEWVRIEAGVARIGITAYAQEALGDVVFVTLPESGTAVEAGQTCGEVESTKSVSDVYAPVTGSVVRRNEALEGTPELVNSDPYGEGWMFEVRLAEDISPELLDAATYRAQLG